MIIIQPQTPNPLTLQKEKEKTPPPAQVEEKKVYKMEIKKKEKKPGSHSKPEFINIKNWLRTDMLQFLKIPLYNLGHFFYVAIINKVRLSILVRSLNSN